MKDKIEFQGTFSALTTIMRRPSISWSDNRENRTMAHLLWIGSIILADVLQARAKRVVLEYISIVLLKACCAPVVMLNTKSKNDTESKCHRKQQQQAIITTTQHELDEITMKKSEKKLSPVSFIQYNYLVSARRQRYFLLSKHLDLVPHNIYSSTTKTKIGI